VRGRTTATLTVQRRRGRRWVTIARAHATARAPKG
jgi:hypothetical protein